MDKRVILQDIFDKDGNLKEIECLDPSNSQLVFVAIWDINDEQTRENRIAFREWVGKMVKRKGYSV